MNSKMAMQNVNPTLESGNYDSAVLFFGVNDLLQKALSKSEIFQNLIKNIGKLLQNGWSIESFCVGDCAKQKDCRIALRRS